MSGVFQLAIDSWSAWFPNVESLEELQRWSCGERAMELEGAPKVAFLPALMRRRLSSCSRIALELAYRACPPELRSQVRSVFASRYGEQKTSVELLENIAAGEPFSPTSFSHSVHNTAAAYFSIAAENRKSSTSLAAGRDTLMYSLLEASLLLERDPSEAVLVVCVGVPLDPIYRDYLDERLLGGGIAFVLSRQGKLPLSVQFDTTTADISPDPTQEQHLTLLIRWLLSSEKELALEGARHSWALRSPTALDDRIALYSEAVV